ncbi:MAG: hypothetical protein JOY81_03190 [Alphaproteobacteria bacterium]|nr:hypothetical protein [Alphaproteobacteria bacterium]
MTSRALAAALAVLAPWAADAADYPVKFGEIRNGAVVPAHTLKMCPKSTGYAYGFEILLPEQGAHEVSGDLYWPTSANCVSCAHAQESYGKHSGRFVKTFTFESDDQAGTYTLTVIVDHNTVSTIKYDVVASKDCR